MKRQASGDDVGNVGNREATSGCMSGVGQKSGVDLWLGGSRCRAGSRESTSDFAVEDVQPGARVGVVFSRLSQEGGVGDFWKVFPVLIDYPELRLTRRAQYRNCDDDWQCARPFIPF